MKKILITLTLMVALIIGMLDANALSFSEGYQQTSSKPMVLLIYANWSSGQKVIQQNLRALQKVYPGKLNYVLMDIANSETKAFNEKFQINPKLPYVMLFKDGGKVNRYIERDCATNMSCLSSRVKSFLP